MDTQRLINRRFKMKVTKTQLKQIIKEEVEIVLKEADARAQLVTQFGLKPGQKLSDEEAQQLAVAGKKLGIDTLSLPIVRLQGGGYQVEL